MVLQILALVAEWDRDAIIEKTRAGKDRAAQSGSWVGGPPAVGYRLDNKRLVVHEEEANFIWQMYQQIASGEQSASSMARLYNAQGIPVLAGWRGDKQPNQHNGLWYAATICDLIRNRTYMGEHVYNKFKRVKVGGKDFGAVDYVESPEAERVVRKCPAIVSQELWLAANRKLSTNNKVAFQHTRDDYQPAMLKGLIRCEKCGGSYVIARQNTGNRDTNRYYYRCSNYAVGGKLTRCQAAMVRGNELDQEVWNQVSTYIKNPDRALAELEEQIRQQQDQAQPIEIAIEQIEKALEAKTIERQKYIRLVGKGIIEEEEGDLALGELAKEVHVLADRKEELMLCQMDNQEVQQRLRNANLLLVALRRKVDAASDQDKFGLAHVLVSQIRVETITTTKLSGKDKKGYKIQVDYCFDMQDNSVVTTGSTTQKLDSSVFLNIKGLEDL